MRNAPPWTKTITARRFASSAGVQTFRYRQSSLCVIAALPMKRRTSQLSTPDCGAL
jgi:hypothetical protein